MNSSHLVYDIGLNRDNDTVAHAYFSDLMIFTRELGFSSSENVNEIKKCDFSNSSTTQFSVSLHFIKIEGNTVTMSLLDFTTVSARKNHQH